MTTTAQSVGVYRCPDGSDFPVEWPEPGMEQFGWRWDQMHCPLPLTPLSQDFAAVGHEGSAVGMAATGSPMVFERLSAHGYIFSRAQTVAADPAHQLALRGRYLDRHLGRSIELWEREYRPECEALTRAQMTWADRPLTLRGAVDRLDEVRMVRRRHGEVHFLAMGGVSEAWNRFGDWCAAELPGGGDALAGELTQGMPNRSLDSANGLWELSRLALETQRVGDLLRTAAPATFLARLGNVTGGTTFRAALDAYLEEFGLRTESFYELTCPTWREDPKFALFLIRGYLDSPAASSPGALHRAVADRRLARTAEVESALSDDPRKLAEFRRLQHDALERTVLLEDHNFYIDQQGFCAPRFPCLAVGRLLAEAGAVDAPEDVFYLRSDDLRQAAASGGDFRPLVARRRAEHARWVRVLPPTYIGGAPAATNPAGARFFGAFSDEPEEPGIVKGTAGSPGVIRGTARLVLTLDAVDRLGDGEILVTYATAPTWTPLFAIAGAVVTDAGGVLSHCAVVAREYGIPAVVGARTATARIPDGALITVDGDAGVVRIEGAE